MNIKPHSCRRSSVLLSLALLLTIGATCASAQIAYVNSATPIVNTNSQTPAFGATSLTAGNLLVVQTRWGSAVTITSITDTAGNTYAQAGTDQSLGTDFLSVWYAQGVTGNASNIVTIHFSAPATNVYATTAQYSGLAATSSLDTTTKTSGTTTSLTTSGFTTAQANELIISAVGVVAGSGTTLTPTGTSGTYTKRTIANAGVDVAGIADCIVSSTQSGATATWGDSASDTLGIVVATFKAAGGAAARPCIIGGGVICDQDQR